MFDGLIQKLVYSVVSTFICCGVLMLYYAFYKKGKRMHFEDLIVCILLIVISSLRYGVGSDYFRYLENAAKWSSLYGSDLKSLFTIDALLQYRFEIGYKILSVISYKISQSPYTIFWFVSIIIYCPLVYYCRKYTSDSRIAIAVYLLFGYWGLSLNAIGQSVAMIFILFAQRAMDDKKYLRSFLLIICAEMFHTTAIVAAILIILSKVVFIRKFLEPKKRNLALMIGIGIALKLATEVFRNIILQISSLAQYAGYLSTGTSDLVARIYMMVGALIEGSLVIAILYMAIKMYEKNNGQNRRLSSLISIVMIGIPFNIIGISRSNWLWLSNRFAEYFFLFLTALIPEIIGDSERCTQRGIVNMKYSRIPFWITFIVWHLAFTIVMFNNNQFIIDTYLFK